MLFKLLLWGIVGYIVYTYLRNKLGLKEGTDKGPTIHHHHYKEKKRPASSDDDDYIDYEELN